MEELCLIILIVGGILGCIIMCLFKVVKVPLGYEALLVKMSLFSRGTPMKVVPAGAYICLESTEVYLCKLRPWTFTTGIDNLIKGHSTTKAHTTFQLAKNHTDDLIERFGEEWYKNYLEPSILQVMMEYWNDSKRDYRKENINKCEKLIEESVTSRLKKFDIPVKFIEVVLSL